RIRAKRAWGRIIASSKRRPHHRAVCQPLTDLLAVWGIDRLRGVWWSALPASPAPRADRASVLTRSLIYVNAEATCATSPGSPWSEAPGNVIPGERAGDGTPARGDGMGRRLYVGNLPYTTGEAELQELFSKAGTV